MSEPLDQASVQIINADWPAFHTEGQDQLSKGIMVRTSFQKPLIILELIAK